MLLIRRYRLGTLLSICVLSALILLTPLVSESLFATDEDYSYDINDDGLIDRTEIMAAINDYFADAITKDEVIEVIQLYFTGISIPTPVIPPTDTPPQATALPVSTSPVPTITPGSFPIAPTITLVSFSTTSLQLHWEYHGPDTPVITGYNVRYRGPDYEETVTLLSPNIQGRSIGGQFPSGSEFTISIRALSVAGPSPWASETRVIPAPVIHTPTPEPSPTSYTHAYVKRL